MFVFFLWGGSSGSSRSRRPNEKNAKKKGNKKNSSLNPSFLQKESFQLRSSFTTSRVIKTTQTNDTHGRRDASKEEKRYGARLRREKRAFRDALLRRRVLRSLPFETSKRVGDSPPLDLNSSLGRRRSSRFRRASRKD